MKTKEELNAIKEEVETLNKKLAELTEEELEQVRGGDGAGNVQVGDWCAYGPVSGKFQISFSVLSGETTEFACRVSRVSPLMLKGYVCHVANLSDGSVNSHIVECIGQAFITAAEIADKFEPIPAPWWAADAT